MRLRKILLGAFLGVEASSSGCPDPIIWYRLRFESAVNFVSCSENKVSKNTTIIQNARSVAPWDEVHRRSGHLRMYRNQQPLCFLQMVAE
ncbi:Oidioi.mRNA.OKI2018_I69.chr1.g1065.t1.cds [Oikopleura dioica]|uniref:Oidioi.mRNA.OKI2018_I69.chr1.g1065.t1.cds n=1 Tax=Oikopleura dioica TaxID=34765 RepID=A0ABN7SR31_OIKDI|nr:Oidioi.mRNA.OKI2018_I69.chr1.g1065.t1.cds [Oikopleura dioica]